MHVYPLVAYVAGPYRDPRGAYYVCQNIRRAEVVAVALWQMGLPNICPHKNTALLDGAAPDAVWLAGDLEMLRRCDLLVLVPGWEKSTGTQEEVRTARRMGIPVFEWTVAGMAALNEWMKGKAE